MDALQEAEGPEQSGELQGDLSLVEDAVGRPRRHRIDPKRSGRYHWGVPQPGGEFDPGGEPRISRGKGPQAHHGLPETVIANKLPGLSAE